MDMNSFVEVFEHVKDYFRNETQLSEVAINLWINSLKPVRFEGNTAVFFVPSDFQRGIVLKQYEAMLKEAFLAVLGFEVEIEIEIPDDENVPVKEINSESKRAELEAQFQSAEYEYTFDTFIVGRSNEFAYAACTAVANNKNSAYNPLFIHGPSGLGKTHLLTAIQNEIKLNNPSCNIIYVSGDSFTNEMIGAIRTESMTKFHDKYRNADILLVDDVQFIAGKESTQEEFFHTFNELHKVGKQIVLTSDRPPKDIKTLEDRIRTRFEWGLIADISTPDFETRIAIIRRKAELLNFEMPADVAEFIANRLKTNIRQLEGAVKKLKALKHLAGTSPSITMAQSVIKDILNDNQPVPVTVEKIIKEVSGIYSVSAEDIRSTKRSASISNARKVAIYIVREITGMPLKSIGVEFGGRDHATIVYAIQSIEDNMKIDNYLKETIEDTIKNIRDN